MSEAEPTKPYVYQPYGMGDKDRVAAGRIYGIGFPWATHKGLTLISGLTKEEAQRVCAALLHEGGLRTVITQWVERHFSAAHDEGDVHGHSTMHGHTWIVRAYWPDNGEDIRDRAESLAPWVAKVDHSVLPPKLSRGEELAAWFGVAVGAVKVEVWREREGYGATWTA